MTPPATEPVDLAAAKDHCRVPQSDTTQDAQISRYITDARRRLEIDTERGFITQTRRYSLPSFYGVIQLPGTPLASVSSVKYYDTDGAEQTVDPAVYEVRVEPSPGLIAKLPNQSWPTVQAGRILPVSIEYVCGVATAAEVPELTVQAILLLVSHWYENRTDAVPLNMYPIPAGYDSLAKSLSVRLIRSSY